MRRSVACLLVLAAAACGGEGADPDSDAQAENVVDAAGEALLPDPKEAEHLANEAAADEAADMALFGGNAAAAETPNGAEGDRR